MITTFDGLRTFLNANIIANGAGNISGSELNEALLALANLSELNNNAAGLLGRPLKDFKTQTGSWTNAVTAAVGSGEESVVLPYGSISLDAAISITGNRKFSLTGAGRDVSKITLANSNAGFSVGADVRGGITGVSLLGSGNVATGILLAGAKFFSVSDVYAENLLYGVRGTDTGRQTVPIGPQLTNVVVNNSGYGFSFENDAEYATLLNCQAYGCTNAGVTIRTGNCKIIGGSFMENLYGIVIDSRSVDAGTGATIAGASGNPDHGGIFGATVNHNYNVGIALIKVVNGFTVTGCNVWATIGNAGVDTTYRRADHTVGLYIEDSKNVTVSGGLIANNRINVALSGVTTSKIDVALKSDPTRTAFQMREYAGGVNAQNSIRITTQGSLLLGESRGYIPLTDTNSQTNAVEHFSDNTPRVVTLTGSMASYDYTGDTAHVVLKTDYTGVLRIPPIWRQQIVRIAVVLVSAGQTATAQVVSASAVTASATGATVSGTTITFSATGLYTLYPTGSDSFIVLRS